MSTFRLLLVLCAVGLLPGCFAAPLALGAAGGVATFKVLENQDVREYPGPMETLVEATVAALRELDYPAPAAVPGPTEASVRAGDAAVSLARFPEGKVRVAVRVGTFDTHR